MFLCALDNRQKKLPKLVDCLLGTCSTMAKRKVPAPFLTKLYDMISNCSNSAICSWGPNGGEALYSQDDWINKVLLPCVLTFSSFCYFSYTCVALVRLLGITITSAENSVPPFCRFRHHPSSSKVPVRRSPRFF